MFEKFKKDEKYIEGLEVELGGYGFFFGDNNELEHRPTQPVLVKYIHTFKNKNKKAKKEEISLAVSYCPHCGIKVKDDEPVG